MPKLNENIHYVIEASLIDIFESSEFYNNTNEKEFAERFCGQCDDGQHMRILSIIVQTTLTYEEVM